ncbi:MAG: hypothetical protein BWK79_00515 [Beggiatoa sp. IS2]|nr:MAG: hypothetical protein BWK79_00515 [Beggiatoa sp. IS2]
MKKIVEEIVHLSPERRASFETLLMRGPVEGTELSLQKIFPQQKVKYPPASALQQRFWFIEQFIPENSVHHVYTVWQIEGPLNLDALQHSLEALSQRQETLRTTFSMVDRQLIQVIATTFNLPLTVVEIPESELEINQAISHEIKQSFNLTTRPLWRVTLLRLTKEKYIFILVMHHIITDDQSIRIFLEELSNFYSTFSKGETPQLPPLVIQYADFAVWQQSWLATVDFTEQLAYWQKQLAHFELHPLPTDYPRPLFYDYRGTRQIRILPKILLIALKDFSEQEQVTLFMALLAVFKIFLYQYAHQQDLLVCSPTAGRTHLETESLIGCFNNILLFHTHLNENLSFREVLHQIRQITLEAYAHANVPLQQLTELSDGVNHALPQIMFAVQQPPEQLLKLSDVSTKSLNVYNETADFDFFLIFEKKADEWSAILEYRTVLFKTTTITQILQHLQTLIEAVIIDPTQPISKLPGLTAPKWVTPSLTRNFVSPRNSIEMQLVKIWEKVLNICPISIDDNFFQLGGHSLLAMTLLNRIEKDFNKGLPPTAIFQFPTIAQLAPFLQGKTSMIQRCALESIQPQGKNHPLFFVGSTNYARALAPLLGTEQPIYGLNIFGLQPTDGSKFNLSIEEIAQRYVQEIQTVQPRGPYYLAGYCADARVALEMSQQLHKQGQKVASLIFIDVIWRTQSHFDWHCHWQNFLKFGIGYLFYKIRGKLKFKWYAFVLSFSHWYEKLYRLRGKKLIPKLKHTLLINQFYNALEHYMPTPYPGKITLFLSDEWRPRYSPSGKLAELAQGGIELHEIPGYHGRVFEEPQLSVLAKQLQQCLVQSMKNVE